MQFKKLPYEIAEDNAIKAFQEKRISASLYDNEKKAIHINFWYPNIENQIKEIKLGLAHVRASDGIKIHYDFERDGYVVMQPFTIEEDKGSYIDCVEHWEETGFFKSWALEGKSKSLETIKNS